MIFAAGLGTRLQPLTNNIPKALVEVGGKLMIERVIHNLKLAGVNEIIINLHHFPDQIKSFLQSKNHFGVRMEFSGEEDHLLETGGGLKKAGWFFDDAQPFFVHNVDVLTNVDLKKMMLFHLAKKPLATLFIEPRNSSRYLRFDETGQLCGWTNKKTGEQITISTVQHYTELAFNGVHIIDPKALNLIGLKGKFSIIPAYLALAKKNRILGFRDQSAFFIDIGKPENLAQAETLLQSTNLDKQ
jgi:N-acetyl-alpha-D-muramate 1-phosphate uridylyltransferase